MPSIEILEKDLTKGGGSSVNLDVVFVPGFATNVLTDWPEIKEDGKTVHSMKEFPGVNVPTLCSTLSEFAAHFGDRPALIQSEDEMIEDKSYIYAKNLILAGLPVLYQAVNDPNDSTQQLTTGTIYNELLGTLYEPSSEYEATLYDKGEYQFKYLTSGGYPSFQVALGAGMVVKKKLAISSATITAKNMDSYFYSDYDKHLDYTYVLTYDDDKKVWIPTEKQGRVNGKNGDDFINKAFSVTYIPKTEETAAYYVVTCKDNNNVDQEILRFLIMDGETDKAKPIDNYEMKKDDVIEFSVIPTIKEDNTSAISTSINYYTTEEVISADSNNSNTTNVIADKMIALASTRGDCVAIIDHPDDSAASLTGNTSFHSKFVEWVKSGANFDYGTAFTPWINISHTVEENGRNIPKTISMPPSYGYLMALANSIKTNASWLAVAGATRGQISGLDSTKPLNINGILSNSIAENVYQNRDGVSINAITNIKPFGYRIWGNRTLKNNSLERNLTATSFLNTRNMISDVKKVAYAACKKYTFEQNNDVLWLNFKSEIEPTLNQMKTGAGLSGYKIIKDTTTEKAKLVAIIKLYPLYAVEDFTITVEMLDDEVTVS